MKKTKEEIGAEALIAISGKNRAGVAISMGVGKTLIALKHLQYLNSIYSCKALVVIPKVSLIKTWKNECDKHGLSYLKNVITFCTYRSLSKLDLIDMTYQVIYLDECHNLLHSHRATLSKFSGITIGLTGTPPKYIVSEKGKMINDFCPIVYEYLTDDAIDDGILNDYEITIHYLQLSKFKNHQAGGAKKKWMTSEEQDYLYWCKRIYDSSSFSDLQMLRIHRMKALMKYSTKLNYAKKLFDQSKNRCIIFANTQEQADFLCRHSYHSENKESEENLLKFNAGIINKISSVLQISEGINSKFQEGIIMHAYGNERKTAQRIGRLLRLNPEEKSTMHILCYKNTVDEEWVETALANFDQSKITKINY